jgi:hypothetical protein
MGERSGAARHGGGMMRFCCFSFVWSKRQISGEDGAHPLRFVTCKPGDRKLNMIRDTKEEEEGKLTGEQPVRSD